MDRVFMAAAGIAGALGVGIGAFGAHALRGRIEASALAVYQTGVQYHLVHAVALGIVAWATTRWPGGASTAAGWLFIAGILLFSGSLYILATTGARSLGMITPLGGLCFIAGWACLVVAAVTAS